MARARARARARAPARARSRWRYDSPDNVLAAALYCLNGEGDFDERERQELEDQLDLARGANLCGLRVGVPLPVLRDALLERLAAVPEEEHGTDELVMTGALGAAEVRLARERRNARRRKKAPGA